MLKTAQNGIPNPNEKQAETGVGAMKVLCALIRQRGIGEFETVAMMPITRKTTTRDYVGFRRQVFCSYPGPIEFRFDERTVRKTRTHA